jgi:hypothetical protein
MNPFEEQHSIAKANMVLFNMVENYVSYSKNNTFTAASKKRLKYEF